jgi:hypothetical protein
LVSFHVVHAPFAIFEPTIVTKAKKTPKNYLIRIFVVHGRTKELGGVSPDWSVSTWYKPLCAILKAMSYLPKKKSCRSV